MADDVGPPVVSESLVSVPLAGYTTTRLVRASARAQVYEAERKRDGKRVLAKVFDIDEGVEARVEHEFRLLQELDIEGVVRALGIERAGRQLVLLLDFVAGRNLEQAAGGEPMPVDRFLPQACEMAATLARIHDRRIVHRDIKPSNILIEATTGKIVFADFGISVLLEHERRHLYDPAVLEGTLPYVSPEQTGRTKREVDFRSDLYSLGVTFYELLTGRRPFEGKAPLELVHAHLAQRPRPPHELVPSIPTQLSAIVMKLLEKAPEHRYQSARGLHADLDRLAQALASDTKEPKFSLGEQDYATSLQLPHQLYGRTREREALEDEFIAVAENAERRLVLIGGAVGSGKSALVRSLDPLLSIHGAYVGVGKFEAPAALGLADRQRSAFDSGSFRASELPYRGIAQAFTGALGQILSESDEQLASWKVRLRRTLGPIAGVVGALVPELGLVVGEMGEVPELELGEARNRLHLALARLLGAMAEVAPVVLVLDDLQWADPGSLELLEALLRDSAVTSPVLFIGVYRSDEVDEQHPLAQLIASLQDEHAGPGPAGAEQRSAIPIVRLMLGPLSNRAIEQLLADVLRRTPEDVARLADIIGRKAGNNPLFVRQTLVHLAELGILRSGPRGWEWELDAVAEAGIPDDLLGVMRAKLERLPARERELLQRAACIGSRFDVGLLESIAGLDSDSLAASLYALESEGLITRTGQVHQFSHNRIQEAARDGLGEARRRAVHREIGRTMLARAGPEPRGEALFEIVDQLVQGIADPNELAPTERDELARLNLDAGERALQSAAWRAALRYLDLATRLFGDTRRDAPSFAAHFGLAQALALAGETQAAERAFEALLDWQLSVVDRARVVARRVQILKLQDRLQEAVDYGLAGLERAGVRVPAKPSLWQVLRSVVQAWRAVKGADLASLQAMPDARDESAIAAMHIVTAMKLAAFTADPQLYTVLTALHARLVMSKGYHPTAVEGLAQLSFAGLAMGQIEAARRLCEAVVELAEQRGSALGAAIAAEAVLLMYVGPTSRPVRGFAHATEVAAKRALEAGDRLTAGYLGAVGTQLHVEAGTHLSEIVELEARLRRENPGFGTREAGAIAEMVRRFVVTLAAEHEEDEPGFISAASFADPAISQATRHGATGIAVLGWMLLGEHERARELADTIAGDYERALVGMWSVPSFAMLDAILVGERARASDTGRLRARRRLRKRLATLRRFARTCAENYGGMLEVIEAELAWTRGRVREAFDRFERARSSASDNGRVYVEALACLRLAALAREQGWTIVREGALRGAHEALFRWGAWAAVRRLEQRHALLGSPRRPVLVETRSGERADASSRLTDSSVSSLDLATMLGTMQAISEDLRLEEVITRVLDSAIENAGADRGALLLERAGAVALVAEGTPGSTRACLDRQIPLREASELLPTSLVHFVLRTGESVVVDDVRKDPRFASDEYVDGSGVRSLLCMPIVKQSERVGALVLENRLSSGAFTNQRLETLRVLLAQAASALDNARLYAQLERSEAQWRSLVDGVPDIIALLDEQGRIEFINHIAPYVSDRRDLVGQAADEFMDSSSATAWRAALAEVVETGERRELEICVAPAGGTRRWFMTRITPIRIAGRSESKASRYLSVSTDVTARKGLEAQLRQQQRLESVGTLASGVAHEINNPVQGIMNYAELVTERADDPPTVREFAGEIIHETKRVAGIVRNLLSFARKESEQDNDESQVRALVEDTLSLIRAVLRKDQIGVSIEIPDALPTVRCRPQQIQQIIMNLVTNARDALNERFPGFDERKRIDIRASEFVREGERWVRLSVVDRGGGIPDEVRGQIFDPFFTTKGRYQGTGLGLAVSHKIATDHGGDLWVESELGIGSSFHLDLPAS